MAIKQFFMSLLTLCVSQKYKHLFYIPNTNCTARLIRVVQQIVLLLLCQCGCIQLEAVPNRLYTTEQGLSSLLVNYLYQDRYGMIWIATEDGLNRYDGVKITVYRHKEEDPNSLASDYVKLMKEDADGNLVVNTYAGLQLYRRATDDFSPLALLPSGGTHSSFNITMLASDTQGELIATGERCYHVAVIDEGRSLQLDTLQWQLPYHESGRIAQHQSGNLWIHNAEALTEHRMPGGEVMRRLPLPASGNGQLDIMIVGTDGLYLASQGNLYSINSAGLHQLNTAGDISKSALRSVIRYDSTHLLIGSDGDGVFLLNEHTGQCQPFSLEIEGVQGSHLKVQRMLCDTRGNLWAGLYQHGIAHLNLATKSFETLSNLYTEGGMSRLTATLALCPDADGGYWVGTDGDGLYYYNPDLNQWIHYDERQISPTVNTVFCDSYGSVWIGSYGYPCYRRRRGQQQFDEVRNLFGSTGHSPRVFSIDQDQNDHLWLGTMGNGLYCYDLGLERRLELNCGDINPYINSVLAIANHRLMVGTFDGIYVFDTRQPQAQPAHYCSQYIVYCLAEDHRHRLWAGTSNGLLCYDADSKEQRHYTISDGLPANTIYAINPMDDLLWLSTGAGLASIDEHGKCRVYGIEDGLSSNAFSKGATMVDSEGRLWFGGCQGITMFSPQQLRKPHSSLHPRITALYVDNHPATAGTLTGGRPVMSRAAYESSVFSLAHDANSFSIELATLELEASTMLSFHYSLDDAPWVALPPGQHMVNFSQLTPGHHSFRYCVSVGDTLSDAQQVFIEIRHPWWSSPWALVGYMLVLCGILIFVFHWWHSQAQLKLLTLISHKIRTPLSLIVSPLEQLIEEETDTSRLKVYQLMLRNANRMRRLTERVTEQVPLGPIEPSEDNGSTGENLPAEQKQRLQPRHRYEVLLVEDDVEMRQYLAQQFSLDCKVRVANNGKEALTMIFEHQPDAIVSDVTMPEMDGIALCRRLKKNIKQAHIPIVLLTARADEESTLQGLGLGADAYITKPFSIQILKQTVHNIIELRQQLRNLYQGQQLQENRLDRLEAEDYDDRLMERIMQVVNRQLSNPDLNADMLCEEVGISRTQLYRKLKEKTNQSVSIFVRNVRLKQAEQLLRLPHMRVGEVALKVGFKDISYFVKQFKEVYGISPSQWKDQNAE